MASMTPYVRQNAPIMPLFAVGSSCFASWRFWIASLPGATGHCETSVQSPYSPRIPSRLQNGASYTWYTYSPSQEQLGQYISRVFSNVVGSHSSIPIMAASFLATGSYLSLIHICSAPSAAQIFGAPQAQPQTYGQQAQPQTYGQQAQPQINPITGLPY